MTFDIWMVALGALLLLATAGAVWSGVRGLGLARGPQAAPRDGPPDRLRGEPRSKAGRWLVAALSALLAAGVIGIALLLIFGAVASAG